MATLSPNIRSVGCVAQTFRFDEVETAPGRDELDFSIFASELPFAANQDRSPAEWTLREQVDAWFVSIAQAIYQRVSFDSGAIGHEVSMRADGPLGLDRYDGRLISKGGILEWRPPLPFNE